MKKLDRKTSFEELTIRDENVSSLKLILVYGRIMYIS